jgi:hypothetical protein
MCKEEFVAEFKVLSHHLPGDTEINHGKISVRIADLRVEI